MERHSVMSLVLPVSRSLPAIAVVLEGDGYDSFPSQRPNLLDKNCLEVYTQA